MFSLVDERELTSNFRVFVFIDLPVLKFVAQQTTIREYVAGNKFDSSDLILSGNYYSRTILDLTNFDNIR